MRMVLKVFVAASAAISLTVASASAQVFVGSWEVDGGGAAPGWPNNTAYSGLTAAAFLFGGSPFDYVISTVDNSPADINGDAWYSTIYTGGGQFADTYLPSSVYQNEPDASAYVNDNLRGPEYTNYAFRINDVAVTPEPATMTLLATGMVGMIGAGLRRRKARRN